MAYAEKRGDTYRLRASCGYSADGRQIQRSKTWKPVPGMSEKKIQKELEKELLRFQEECDSCTISGDVKFSVFADQWFAEYAVKKLKASSYQRMKKYTERVYQAIGHLRMDKITPRHIQQFINNLSEPGINQTTGGGLSPKTIKEYRSFISNVFRYAIRMGMVRNNPCENTLLPTQREREHKVYTLEQTQIFLEALENAPIMWKAFCTLAIYSGLRRGELLGLEWPDINFEDRLLTVARISYYTPADGVYTDTPKTTGSRRSIRLAPVVFDVLRQWKIEQAEKRLSLGDQWHDTGRVFTGWNGESLHPNAPYNWLSRFCSRINLPFYGIHHFRHINASLQIASGADVKSVSANLGHSVVSTTLNIYAHAFDEARARASEGVGDLLVKQPQRSRRA